MQETHTSMLLPIVIDCAQYIGFLEYQFAAVIEQ